MDKEKEYHRARRMFFIIDNNLTIASESSEKSHSEWLKEQGWSDGKIKDFFKTGLRGVVNPDGNIRFYVGENWEINDEIEEIFFENLPELVKKLNINPEAKIGGGAIRQELGEVWPVRKEYGKVGDFIKK